MLTLKTGERSREWISRQALLIGVAAVLGLAVQCAAAPGTVVLSGLSSTSPGGFVYDGASWWVTDRQLGFCRLDPAPPPPPPPAPAPAPGSPFVMTNCQKPSTTAVLGQPAYDAVNKFVYLPDRSTTSRGIWRFTLTPGPVSGGPSIFTSPFNIASTLGSQRPGAIALGSDGNLYVSMTANATVVRVTTATQAVGSMATTQSGQPAHALAFVGTQLWIADLNGVLVISDAINCGNKCRPILNTQVGISGPLSLVKDNVYVYVGTADGVFRYNPNAGQTELYSNSSPATLFSDVTAVGVDNFGNLYLADDPTAGQDLGGATVYTVRAGSAPGGQGPVPSVSPTVLPKRIPGAISNPAALYTSGSLTAPRAAVFMGTHLWIVDSAKGFCKVDPTLPAPSLTACAVLPAGVVPGAPAFDPGPLPADPKFVYIPDTTTAGAGILRLPFDPVKETVGASATYARLNLLTTAAPGSTAPTSVAFGPDSHLYVAMAGTKSILRITTPPAGMQVRAIGTMNAPGTVALAFHNLDLYDAEPTNSSVLQSATLCQGNCVALFLGIILGLPTSVAADSNFVYIGENGQVWRYDPLGATISILADTGLANGVPTSFSAVGAVALDASANHVFAADPSAVWSITNGPQLLKITPASAAPGTSVPVTITGSGLTGATLNMPAGITASGVTVVDSTKITATFAVDANAPLGTPTFTVTTPAATSNLLSFAINSAAPSITSITPAIGAQGDSNDSVTIVGTNLTGVNLNVPSGVTAVVVSNTGTQITATFAIAATAPLGPQSISVTNPLNPPVTSGVLTFTINPPPPTLTSISPASGSQGKNVAVTIAGTNLANGTFTLPPGISVTPSSIVTTATQISATFAISATAPLAPAGSPPNITYTTAGGTASILFVINPPPPVLTTITPSTGNQGGSTAVTLTGTNLTGASLNGNLQAGITATGVTVVSDTQITATFNLDLTATLGPQPIIVTTAAGASNAVNFTVNPPLPPTLTGVSPTVGVQGNSVNVSLTGTNLLGSTAINAGPGITVSNLVVVSRTQVTATFAISASAALGPQNVTITAPGGTSAVNPQAVFTINPPPPTLSAVSPNLGAQGSSVNVTLTGTNLTGASAIIAGPGITVSNLTVVSATQVTATFAIGASAATGPQNVTITTPGGTSAVNPQAVFTINAPAPTLTAINPNTGAQGTSVNVTLTGTNLTAASAINAGPGITVSNMAVVNATQVTATFAIGASAATGPQNVTITTPGGTSPAVVFTITAAAAPTLTAIAPSAGNQGASVNVSLAGTNLVGASAINAGPGITVSNVVVLSATQATATFNIGAGVVPGSQNVTVTTPAGTSAVNPQVTFTVNVPPSPTLTAVSPNAGTQGGSLNVTLTGTNLTAASAISAGAGITVSSLVVIGPTQVTATFAIGASAATGPQNVTITTPGGTSGAVVFTINQAPPTLTAISPSSGIQGTSAGVTLTGTNLTAASAINVPASSGITVSNLVVVSSTQVTATFTIGAGAASGPQNVTITTPGGTTSAVVFTINQPTPTLTAINPNSGVQGTSVNATLTGTNLTNASAISAGPGITVSNLAVVSPTQATATFAIALSAATGPQNVTITTPGGTSLAVVFTINAPPTPTLSGISPNQALQASSVNVTLTGTNLTNAAAINAGPGITVSNLAVVDSAHVTATFAIVAGAATGPQNVTITTPGGTSPAVVFTINQSGPTLAGIAPNTGAQGTSVNVTLNGTNLTNSSAINAGPGITVSNLAVVDSAHVTATFAISANAATGPQNVTITTPGGTSPAVVFSITQGAPTLTAIAPNVGAQGSSLNVSLSGTFLTNASAINAGPGITVSNLVVVSANQVTATFTIGAGASTGPQNVVITTPGGASAPNAGALFTVNTPPAPTLTSVSPAASPVGSSVSVTIAGTNLNSASLSISGTGVSASNVVIVSSTQITATFTIAATAAQGAYNVSVSTPGGTSNALTFSVLSPAPILTSIQPTSVKHGDNNVGINLNGSNLTGATINSIQVFLNGAPTNAITMNQFQPSATQVRVLWTMSAAAPLSANGNQYTVTISTPSGTSNALPFTMQ